MTLSQITPRKFIESYPCKSKFIDTPTGQVEVLEVHKTIKYDKYKIILENAMTLEAAHNHVIINSDNNEVYVKDSLNEEIITTNGPSKVIDVQNLHTQEHMYDLSLASEEEVYYSNGILSHNSGKSVTVAVYLSHTGIFGESMDIGIAANQGGMAKEFLDKTKNILSSLPIWMQQGIRIWNRTYIEFENKTKIMSSATSANSFRGFTCNIVVVDECVEYNEIVTVRDDTTGVIKNIKIGEQYDALRTQKSIKTTVHHDEPNYQLFDVTNKFSVLATSGFKKFDGIKRTTSKQHIKFIFNDDTNITVTPSHKFLVGKTSCGKIYRRAHKFKIGHKLSGKTIKTIQNNSNSHKEFFDLLNVTDGNHYITSGVTSHNCAFIKPATWDEFKDAIFPSQSGLAFKKAILISTANGLNHFYEYIDGARNKTNGFVNYEVQWQDVPRYHSDGSQKTNEEFMEEIVKKYGIVYWNQNYANDFIGSSHTLLSADTLKTLKPKVPEEVWDNKLNIYHKPQKGHQYIMSIDPAKDGKDAFSIDVIDITGFKFRQVASANLQIDYLLMPEFINEWCQNYFTPYLIIENNEGAGQSIADQMKNTYEYENLHYDTKADSNNRNRFKSRKTYPGTRTSKKSRTQILKTMKTFIENNNLEINDAGTIKEFFTFILQKNKYQADEGTHDDNIMSLALSFTLFNDAKNFEDMKKVSELLFQDQTEQEEVDVSDIISVGGFDDGVEENETFTQEPTTYEEYLSSRNEDEFY